MGRGIDQEETTLSPPRRNPFKQVIQSIKKKQTGSERQITEEEKEAPAPTSLNPGRSFFEALGSPDESHGRALHLKAGGVESFATKEAFRFASSQQPADLLGKTKDLWTQWQKYPGDETSFKEKLREVSQGQSSWHTFCNLVDINASLHLLAENESLDYLLAKSYLDLYQGGIGQSIFAEMAQISAAELDSKMGEYIRREAQSGNLARIVGQTEAIKEKKIRSRVREIKKIFPDLNDRTLQQMDDFFAMELGGASLWRRVIGQEGGSEHNPEEVFLPLQSEEYGGYRLVSFLSDKREDEVRGGAFLFKDDYLLSFALADQAIPLARKLLNREKRDYHQEILLQISRQGPAHAFSDFFHEMLREKSSP